MPPAGGAPRGPAGPGQVVERVACEEIRQHPAGRPPVAQQVRAAGHADRPGAAEVLKVRDRERVRGPALVPCGRVDGVPHLPSAQERIDAVLPEAVVHEAHRDGAPHPERLQDDARRVVELVHRPRADDAVEMPVRERQRLGRAVDPRDARIRRRGVTHLRVRLDRVDERTARRDDARRNTGARAEIGHRQRRGIAHAVDEDVDRFLRIRWPRGHVRGRKLAKAIGKTQRGAPCGSAAASSS